MKNATKTKSTHRIKHHLKVIRLRLRKRKEFPLFTHEIKVAIYGIIAFCFGVVMRNLTPKANEEHMASKVETDNVSQTTNLKNIGLSMDFVIKREKLITNDAFLSFVVKMAYPTKEKSQTGVIVLPNYKSCFTPRGYSISHGESMLAYMQDENTPDTCYIQRRFCLDGKLSGEFDLQSCKENTKYSYKKEKFVIYNSPEKVGVLPENLQSQPEVNNSNENLSLGKIDENSQIDPTFIIQPGKGISKDKISDAKSLDQSERPTVDCITPRGELVKDGNFIKAYKTRHGTNLNPCEVQLRTCILGQLEGSYKYENCSITE